MLASNFKKFVCKYNEMKKSSPYKGKTVHRKNTALCGIERTMAFLSSCLIKLKSNRDNNKRKLMDDSFQLFQ
jgi:hypothetical protein